MMICGTGWLSWSAFREPVADWEAVWVDLSGPHAAGVPDAVPEATHFWAWSGDRWCRARIDEGEVVAGFLHPRGECPLAGEGCAPVATSHVLRALSWAEEHVRVGSLRGAAWDVIEAVDGVAATFVRRAWDEPPVG